MRQSLAIPTRASMREHPLLTQRARLSPVDPSDAPELWTVVEASRQHLERWLPWVPFNSTPEASQRYAFACASDWDAGRALRFSIRERTTGALLGVVGLDSCVHLHRSCELGYWLGRNVVGRGFMTEAAGRVVRFAFDQLGAHRVRCAAATGNGPSLAVIGRLGFKPEGVARQAEYVNQRWVDHAVFGLLATD